MCVGVALIVRFFFFNDTATTEIYTLSLHDALPIWSRRSRRITGQRHGRPGVSYVLASAVARAPRGQDRKSTRLNSSHLVISYAVFCLKKKKTHTESDGSHGCGTRPPGRMAISAAFA